MVVSDFNNYSPTNFWRSDNPAICAWYRFGDDSDPESLARYLPDDSGDRAYNSGLLVDSSNRQNHLVWGSNLLTNLNDAWTAASGIPSYSVSGLRFGGSRWTDIGNIRSIIYIDPEGWGEAGSGGSRGHFGFGTDTLASGFAVMGWATIPDIDGGGGTSRRPLIGNGEDTGGGNFYQWSVNYYEEDGGENRVFEFKYRDNTGSQKEVTSVGDPFPTVSGEPVFICATIHREIPVPFGQGADGSGLLNLYVGTSVSGLRKIKTTEFASSDLRQQRGTETQNRFSIGMDARNARTNVGTTQHVPSGTVMDEWVMVNFGNMPESFIEHYMNSGIVHVLEDDPNQDVFVPIEPGDTDLVAYWTFDNQDGINSAPITSGGLDMTLAGVSPQPGIRGGSGIRCLNGFGRGGLIAASDTGNFPHVTRNEGLLDLFPDINVSDQWTWIGWVKDRPFGVNRFGGCLGWFNGSENHTAFSTGDWRNGFGTTNNIDVQGRGIQCQASGHGGTLSNAPNGGSQERQMNRQATVANSWQLWAMVWDFRNGILYSVKDANHVFFESQRFSAESGLSRQDLEDNANSLFMFASNANIPSDYENDFDDWAIYKRKLTLPEMSGYALSGIAVSPILGPTDTSDQRVLGAWKLDNSGVYTDPSGDARLRYEDSSWYVHDFSLVSGTFDTDATMNERWGDTSSKVVTSGSMLGIRRTEHGANLDFSQATMFEGSGFTAGMWLNVPSGDFGTFGNGTSGLYGDHHIMGSWSQVESEQSWQLIVRDNRLKLNMRFIGSLNEITSTVDIPFNTDFLAVVQVTPSGGGTLVELYQGTDSDTTSNLQQVERISLSAASHLQAVGASGFSLLNVPHTQQGFPSGTKAQGAFVYAGPLNAGGVGELKRGGITIEERSAASPGNTDIDNVSHWKMDRPGAKITDFGRQQNFLTNRNSVGKTVTETIAAIHASGAKLEQAEWLTTLANNPGTRGLDLGQNLNGEDSSYTVLGWMKPNDTTATIDDEILFGKHPLRGLGYQCFIEQNEHRPIVNSAGIETSGNNSIVIRGDFNHLAIIHDKTKDYQTVLLNGRYAGTTFSPLKVITPNESGFALGGRGDPIGNNFAFGGAGFSGIMDDWMVFSRALTLPEISGLAANSYNYSIASGTAQTFAIGGYLSGIASNIISGIMGAWMHGMAQDLELVGGYVSGVSGDFGHTGGFVHGRAFLSGFVGGFVHGSELVSGFHGGFVHGRQFVSGYFGSYAYGACDANGEFDIAFTYQIVSADDFDARMAVELTRLKEFDARLGATILTAPPTCTLQDPLGGTVVSGLPYTLTVQGSGIANNGKNLDRVRFTFSDFKDAESGTLVGGVKDNGLYQASRVLDTSGLFTVKIETIDDFGYRSSCCQQILVMPSGDATSIPSSGAYLNSLPGLSLTAGIVSGVAKEIVSFTHALSGLGDISGILEYTDYADQQESQITSIEMPTGTIFGGTYPVGVRQHEYSTPGTYCSVWAASGNWGIVTDTTAVGFDVANFI